MRDVIIYIIVTIVLLIIAVGAVLYVWSELQSVEDVAIVNVEPS